MPFLSIEPLLEDLGKVNLSGIAWVIVGGESGHGARPMKRDWVRGIRRQCRAYNVPFFFKQWGGVRKHEAGRMLDGRTYDEFPAVRKTTAPPARNQRLNAIAQIEIQAPTYLGQLATC
jgi:protein gp37